MNLIQLIKEEAYLHEIIKNISDNEIIITSGTKLFHGTIEDFNTKNTTTGGYDNIFWTTDNPAIAQTYIPQSSYYYLSTDSLIFPSKDPSIQKIQKQLGIDYDYSQVKFDGRTLQSYPMAPVFEKISDTYNKLNKKLYNLYLKKREFEKIADNTNDPRLNNEFFKKWGEIEDQYENLAKQLNNEYDITKNMRKYANNILVNKFNYKPTTEDSQLNHSWKIKYDDNALQPANYAATGRLLVITPKKDLKIYDTTNRGRREGDLMNLDYHKHEWFKAAEEKGYDGIKINDFAQSSDQGNIHHTSYGLFKNTLRDVNIQEIAAQHHDLEQFYRSGDWNTPEYKNFTSK